MMKNELVQRGERVSGKCPYHSSHYADPKNTLREEKLSKYSPNFFYANAQRLAVIKAAKPATAVRKPISTFIPRMAAPLVGVVLVSELVEDAAPVVAVAPLVTEEKDMVPVLVCVEEVVEDVVLELMLNWLD
jgi:hypothetical protein